jgi:AcrR family transcriptional regulator
VRSNKNPTFTDRARRNQIIDCASELVAEIGYAQTSIRKIAERVGVAMSVVLYHFANKEELVRAIATEGYRSAIEAIAPALNAETSATGKLHAYIRANVAFMKSHKTQFMAVLDIGLSYRSAAGERLDQVQLEPELLEDLGVLDLAALLREGQETGEFRALDTARVAVALRGAINGAVLELANDPDFDVLAYGEELVTIFDLAIRRT